MSNRISKKDAWRPLITEFLPYETPFIFSGTNFYNNAKLSSSDPIHNKILEKKGKTIPYKYQSCLSENKLRDLDLIHPATQIKGTEIYEKYSSVIIDRCTVSNFSIRKPKFIATEFYEPRYAVVGDELIDDEVESKSSGFDAQSKFFCSYFSYEKYNRLYKFFSSEDFLELEQSFPNMCEFDVSKCFYNIYTHSVSWAIKDKSFAKSTISYFGFEKELDSFMQDMNNKETNGICVGPEASRIFAEIILQDIDRSSEVEAYRAGYIRGKDYDARRYIDNYYLFTQSLDLQEKIFDIFSSQLKKYKLYLNDSKTERLERPFVSSKSLAISEIKQLVNEFFDDIFENVTNSIWRGEAYRVRLARERTIRWESFVSRYRHIVKNHDLSGGEGSSFIFGALRKRIILYKNRSFSHLNKIDNLIALDRFSQDICRIMEYLLRTHMTLRSLDRTLQVIIMLKDLFAFESESASKDYLDGWVSRLFHDKFSGNLINDNTKGNSGGSTHNNLELLCFLVILRHFPQHEEIQEDNLIKVWEKMLRSEADSEDQFPYWPAICLLYYSQGPEEENKTIKRKILAKFIRKTQNSSFLERSDLVYSYLDLSTYPGFSRIQKRVLWKHIFRVIGFPDISKEESDKHLESFLKKSRPYFTNWNLNINILREMEKRELQPGY